MSYAQNKINVNEIKISPNNLKNRENQIQTELLLFSTLSKLPKRIIRQNHPNRNCIEISRTKICHYPNPKNFSEPK